MEIHLFRNNSQITYFILLGAIHTTKFERKIGTSYFLLSQRFEIFCNVSKEYFEEKIMLTMVLRRKIED